MANQADSASLRHSVLDMSDLVPGQTVSERACEGFDFNGFPQSEQNLCDPLDCDRVWRDHPV